MINIEDTIHQVILNCHFVTDLISSPGLKYQIFHSENLSRSGVVVQNLGERFKRCCGVLVFIQRQDNKSEVWVKASVFSLRWRWCMSDCVNGCQGNLERCYWVTDKVTSLVLSCNTPVSRHQVSINAATLQLFLIIRYRVMNPQIKTGSTDLCQMTVIGLIELFFSWMLKKWQHRHALNKLNWRTLFWSDMAFKG